VPNLTYHHLPASIALAVLLGAGLLVVPLAGDAAGFRPEPRWGSTGVSGRAGSFRPVERAVGGAPGRNQGVFNSPAPLLQNRPASSASVFRDDAQAGPARGDLHGQFRPEAGFETGSYQGRYARADNRFRPAQPRAERRAPSTVIPSSAFDSLAPGASGDMLVPLGGYRFTGDPAW